MKLSTVLDLRRRGMSYNGIAQKVGISPEEARKIVREHHKAEVQAHYVWHMKGVDQQLPNDPTPVPLAPEVFARTYDGYTPLPRAIRDTCKYPEFGRCLRRAGMSFSALCRETGVPKKKMCYLLNRRGITRVSPPIAAKVQQALQARGVVDATPDILWSETKPKKRKAKRI